MPEKSVTECVIKCLKFKLVKDEQLLNMENISLAALVSNVFKFIFWRFEHP